MKAFSLFLVLVFSLCACALQSETANADRVETLSPAKASDAEPQSADSGSAASDDRKIRKIDFKNFTYEPFCVGEDPRKVTVAGGEFSEEKQEDGFTDRFFFTVTSVAYGDVNGDAKEDAVVLTVCNTGGTGNFSEGFIYELKNEKPALLARIPGGDRAYGGLKAVRVEKGVLYVESYDPGENGASCCAEYVVTSRYNVSGGKLVETGKADKRELYPARKVSFPKGSTSTTLKLKFTKEEDRKRFSLGAGKGQILRASSPDKNVYFSLRKGEAETSDGESEFTARLKENGDYVIEVQHFTDTESEISVTFEIK